MPYKEKVSAIYAIRNVVSGKMYIGSATNLYNRFAVHRRYLRTGKHFNKHLQSSWTKYGEENFIFGIIEYTEYENLVQKEEYYIQLYKSNKPEKGYNKREKCNTNFGIKISEETRKKLRESHLGHKRSPEAQVKISAAQFKKVCKINMQGETVEVFFSIKEAAERTGLYPQSISMCCRKILNKVGGFYWCYEKDIENFKIPVDGRTTRFIRKKRN